MIALGALYGKRNNVAQGKVKAADLYQQAGGAGDTDVIIYLEKQLH